MLRPHYATITSIATASEQPLRTAQNKTRTQTNWVQCVLKGLQDFLHVLSSDGKIRYVSDSCKTVVGYGCTQLLGRFITDFIHPDDLDVFVKELNEALVHDNPVRFIYRFRNASNDWVILESQCNIYRDGKLNSIPRHRELIIMARPYLSKSTALFDSFLEHKIVHERLMQQMAQLKHEESEADMHHEPRKTQVVEGVFVAYVQSWQSGRYQDKPQVQVEVASFSVDSDNAYVPSAKAEGADTLVMGDAGIPFSRNTNSGKTATNRAHKKRKAMVSCICMFCGSLESPEWRKGPGGPKTLCNACGLRWSKDKRSRING